MNGLIMLPYSCQTPDLSLVAFVDESRWVS